MRRTILLMSLLAVVGFGQNLLTNGDFEQDLSIGWTQSGYGVYYMDRQTGYNPDPDYEAFDSLYGYGFGKLNQIVDAPGITLSLDFWAKFELGGGSSSCWPVAAVTVGYYDADNVLLGESRIYYHNEYCTWTPSGTLSLIPITTPDWTLYTLDIAQEISSNLPGVNPGDVAKVGVALWDTTSGG
jgi:hypothetical protein